MQLLKPPSTFPAASSINITADSGIVKAVYKPPELRSKVGASIVLQNKNKTLSWLIF